MSPLDDTSRAPTLYPPDVSTVYPGSVPTLHAAGRLTLFLGVLDQPYRAPERGKKQVVPVTTGEVASILQAKYGLFSAFFKARERRVLDSLAISVQNSIEALISSRRAIDPWGASAQQIQREFRDFISSGEAERVGIPGTPTKAALRGVNHRRAHPYRSSNPRRPSFRDAGLLSTSFRAWVA